MKIQVVEGQSYENLIDRLDAAEQHVDDALENAEDNVGDIPRAQERIEDAQERSHERFDDLRDRVQERFGTDENSDGSSNVFESIMKGILRFFGLA